MRASPHGGAGFGAQNRAMIPRDAVCTLTLLRRPRDGRTCWEIRCDDDALGEFDSLAEALATARTMAAHWLGEAETVRVTGGDRSAVYIDETYSRAAARA